MTSNPIAGVTVHHVDDYGADPTGDAPSDDALDAAIDAADDGDWIGLTNGTYYLARGHEICKELVICGTGAVIESDYHAGHGYTDDYPRESASDGTQIESLQPLIAFRGERGDRVGLREPVREGEDSVRVADPDAFDVGDGVLLCNENVDVRTKVGAVGNRTRTYEPTVSTVRAIDDDTLLLAVPARYDYAPGGPGVDPGGGVDGGAATNGGNSDGGDGDGDFVYPLDFLDRTGFVDCHFRNRHEPYFDEDLGKVMGGFRHAMLHEYCRAPVVRDCSVRGYDTKMWVPIDVLEAQVLNPRAEAPLNVNGSHGEPIYILGSTNVTIYNPVIRGARRSIDVRAGCKDVTVYNPDISGATFLGLSYHHGYGEHVRGNLNVHGGRVVCKPTDPTQDDHGGNAERRWELQRGAGMRGTPANGRVRVSNTSFVVRHRGGHLYGSDTVIEGCEFETVPRGGGCAVPVLEIAGENVTVRNSVVRASRHGADHTSAVRVADGRNVDLDLRVEGSFADAPVVVDGGERIRLRARVSGPGTSNGDRAGRTPAIRVLGDVTDLALSGDVYDSGPGIAVTGDADLDGVRIREFVHRGSGPAIRIDGDAVASNLRIAGVWPFATDTGDEADGSGDEASGGRAPAIDLGGAAVDGLWVRDVDGDVVGLSPGQSDADRTDISGVAGDVLEYDDRRSP